MIDGAVASAELPVRGPFDGVVDEGLRPLDGDAGLDAARELGGDGGGERAPGAVVVVGVDARQGELEGHGTVAGDVHGVGACLVAALHHGPLGTYRHELVRRRDLAFEIIDQVPREHRRLAPVGSDDERMRDEQFDIGPLGVRVEQALPGRRHHDRIHDEVGQPALGGQIGDDGHVGGGGQHAGLDRGDREVVEDRLDLQTQERRVGRDDPSYLDGVLGGERGDRRAAVDAERRERPQVGLDAGAAPRVGSRDREGDRRGEARVDPIDRVDRVDRVRRVRRRAHGVASPSCQVSRWRYCATSSV